MLRFHSTERPFWACFARGKAEKGLGVAFPQQGTAILGVFRAWKGREGKGVGSGFGGDFDAVGAVTASLVECLTSLLHQFCRA